MLIYVEGVDGSGKTRLVKKLAKDFRKMGYRVDDKAELRVITHPKGNRVSESVLYKELELMMRDKSTLFIMDRGPLTDIIYRLVDQEKSVTELGKFLTWASDLADVLNIIYCRTSNAKELMLQRGDDNPYAVKYHDILLRAYEMVMPLLSIYGPAIHVHDWQNAKHYPKIMEYMLKECEVYGVQKIGG